MKNKKIFYLIFVVAVLTLAVGILRNVTEKKLRSDIGQMLIIGFRGTEVSEGSFIVKAIRELNIGGVILFDIDGPTKSFPRNIVNAQQVSALIAGLKKNAKTPLIVAVDAEGGGVNRLKPDYGFIAMPGAQELGGRDDLALTRRISGELASQLSQLGFNVNFAPCVDLGVNLDNPVIARMGRSFSADAETVVRHAAAFIKGQKDHGILTAIKHFPGHGSSQQDSHKGLTDVTATYKANELIPYQELIKDGIVDMVMTAHIINKNIDDRYPATLSGRYIQEILRERLGFQGVVVSD
ncbi:MAG TPA: glycoside hydrolase family 3 N-terminal domain-containing protein, partial [Candidatus Omnitrophota bacterium]|nr:glycoside hydrolase family 3 N-terminal domain-containing protein [Candidatus Omnitrophota bacterium]